MFQQNRPLLALLPPFVALFVQWILWPYIQPYVWFLFYPAVFASSWLGGFYSGIRAATISIFIVWWFFIPPLHTLLKPEFKQLFPTAIFLLMGIAFSVIHERLRQANLKIKQLYEKTKHIDDLRTQFFANVSHELRTPLALIIGPTERMLQSAQSKNNENDLRTVLRNAKMLLNHVNDLLDVSKIEAKQMSVEYAYVDCSEIVHFVADHFDVIAKEKNINYAISVPDTLLAHVDPDKLRRILFNLLSNAFKFTPQNGKVRISLSHSRNQFVVEVADSGPGIPADQRQLVLERFYQYRGGLTREYGGTGLGLAIVRDFIALHNGTLEIEDAPEGGALFRVTLPLQAQWRTHVRIKNDVPSPLPFAPPADNAAPPIVAELKPPAPPTSRAVILVVEDNVAMNQFICECLSPEHHVERAFNGKEGLERAIDIKPDLILSDLMMPQLSGEALIQAVRSTTGIETTPIVLLTAKADEETRITLLKSGVQDILIKPFSIGELRARINNALQSKLASQRLENNEKCLRDLVALAPDGLIVINTDGNIVDVNSATSHMLGYSRNELLGAAFTTIVSNKNKPFFSDASELSNDERQLVDMIFCRKDGTEFCVELSRKTLPDGRHQCSVRDVSERKQREEQLQKTAIVFEHTSEGVIVTDSARQILMVNHAFETMSGYSADECIGKNPSFLHSGRQGKEFYAEMWSTINQSGHWQGELWNRHKNGDIYPVWQNITAVKNKEGVVTNYVAIASNIRTLKQAEDRLQYLANHDPLTGLPNRLFFSESLKKSIKRAKRQKQSVAVMFLDLDHFKLINDTLGHAAGDFLLKSIADKIKNTVRNEDFVARLGGDEFTLVLEDIAQVEDLIPLMEKLITVIAEPILLDEREVSISASIGISIYPNDAPNADEMIKAADTAMYRAKERGRNTYEFYTPKLTVRAQQRMALENDLRMAHSREQFELFYQPQLDAASKKITGVEALLRWHHPEKGLLIPEQFLGAAEDCGFIVPLGEWIIRQACAQASAWAKAGIGPLRLAINVSGKQFLKDKLIDVIQSAMTDTRLQETSIKLELEITETTLQYCSQTVAIVEALRSRDIGVTIDDFGTGYSSLCLIKHLAIDTLKIDKAFVNGLPESKNNCAIVNAIISVGKSLDLRIVAEGVENQAQFEYLQSQGCHEMQGYLFAEPMSSKDMTRLLESSMQ